MLCISKFQLHPPPPPSYPGYCRAFARLVSPGGGAFARHLPTPTPFPSFWHTHSWIKFVLIFFEKHPFISIDCAINEKCYSVNWQRTGHLPSLFIPTLGDLTAQESPPLGICHPSQKNGNAQGIPGGGGGGGLGTARIDWCINLKLILTCNKYISTPPHPLDLDPN